MNRFGDDEKGDYYGCIDPNDCKIYKSENFKKVTNNKEHQRIVEVYNEICKYNGEVLNFSDWFDVNFIYNILGHGNDNVYENEYNLFYIEKDGEVKAFSVVDTFPDEGKVYIGFICSQNKSGFGEKLIKKIMEYYGKKGYSFLILDALNEKLNNYYDKFDPILRKKNSNGGDKFYYKIGKNVQKEFIKNFILIYLNIVSLSSVCDNNGFDNHKYFFKEIEFNSLKQFIDDVLKKYDEIDYKNDENCKNMFIKDRKELLDIVNKLMYGEISSVIS